MLKYLQLNFRLTSMSTSSDGSSPSNKMFEICDCWNDDERMDSLFAPFREKTVNPIDWDHKLSFWKSLIYKWCIHNRKYSFTIQDLRNAFLRKGNTPACLQTVINEMYRNKELIVCSDLTNIPGQKSWTSWTLDMLVVKPVLWTFGIVKKSIIQPPSEDITYVHVTAIKDESKKLLVRLNKKPAGEVLDLEEINSLCEGNDVSSMEELLLNIHWLRREGKLSVYGFGDKTVVKLGSGKLTECDKATFSLRHAESTLWKHMEQLETEKLACLNEAKEYLRKDKRQMARVSLWKKKCIEKSIEKRTGALESVRQLLERIREAQSDAQVLEAFKVGSASLRKLMKDEGLSEDAAIDTMLNLEEVLDIHNEIQSTLSQPLGDSTDNLEAELAELLQDYASSPPPSVGGTSSKVANDNELDLPAPPTHLPSALPTQPLSQQLEDIMHQ